MDKAGDALVWCEAERIDTQLRLQLRLANMYCVRTCAQAVKLVYDAAGPPSVYEGTTLERCFRDVHVVTQHLMVAPATYELTGRLLLGVATDASQL